VTPVPYVESSMMSFVHYDEVAAELHVVFNTGKAYVYYGVPRKVYDGLMKAFSAGVYFNTNIRHRYRYRRSLSPPGGKSPVSSSGMMR
jgi:KTSC domain